MKCHNSRTDPFTNIDIISHSWGTALSYDLMNDSTVEIKNWVTMGSPLKHTTLKPAMNTGNWINCYDTDDPVTHLEIFPPFPNLPVYTAWNLGALSLDIWPFGTGLVTDPNVSINQPYHFNISLTHPFVHGDYWNSPDVLSDLRDWLQ